MNINKMNNKSTPVCSRIFQVCFQENISRKRSQITIFIIIAILVVAMAALVFMVSPKFKKADEIPETKKFYCKEEQRNADVCIALYESVCGFDKNEKQIKTFSNFCFACMNENAEYYIKGECGSF